MADFFEYSLMWAILFLQRERQSNNANSKGQNGLMWDILYSRATHSSQNDDGLHSTDLTPENKMTPRPMF